MPQAFIRFTAQLCFHMGPGWDIFPFVNKTAFYIFSGCHVEIFYTYRYWFDDLWHWSVVNTQGKKTTTKNNFFTALCIVSEAFKFMSFIKPSITHHHLTKHWKRNLGQGFWPLIVGQCGKCVCMSVYVYVLVGTGLWACDGGTVMRHGIEWNIKVSN